MDVNIGETPAGRLKMELFSDIVPKFVAHLRTFATSCFTSLPYRTAENFRQLCTGEYRYNFPISNSQVVNHGSRVNSRPQGYKGAIFHR